MTGEFTAIAQAQQLHPLALAVHSYGAITHPITGAQAAAGAVTVGGEVAAEADQRRAGEVFHLGIRTFTRLLVYRRQGLIGRPGPAGRQAGP